MATEAGEGSVCGGVAVVAGGCRADGPAIARALAADGFALAVVYLADRTAADAAVGQVVTAGGAAVVIRADVDDELDAARVLDETREALGDVRAVVRVATAARLTMLDRAAARRVRAGGAIVVVVPSDVQLAALVGAIERELRGRDVAVAGVVRAPGGGELARRVAALVGSLLRTGRGTAGADP